MSTPDSRLRDDAPANRDGAPAVNDTALGRPLTRRELRALAAASALAAAVDPEAAEVVLVDAADSLTVDLAGTDVARVTAPVAPATAIDDDDAAAEPADAPDDIPAPDAFAAASVLFAATAAPAVAPVAGDEAAVDGDGAVEPERPAYLGTEPRRSRSNFRRITATSLSVGVIGAVTALTVAMAFPAAPQGNGAAATVVATDVAQKDLQAFVAPSDVKNTDIERAANYEAVSAAQVAAAEGIAYSNAVFHNDPTAAIQWPFAVGTGMSYGYGMRDGRMHEGIDFTPGSGAPIQAIADGTVRTATEDGGGYGVTVYIDHVIDGSTITSHYSHMQYGSLRVKAGDRVKVGDAVGLTGNTGRSFGAHLHFELIVNGATIDPMPWLKEHAG